MNTLDEEEIERLIACDKLLSMAEARIPQLEAEIGRLTAEVEFRKEQIAELFDKQEEISRMARQQEREVWATLILNSQIVRDEWDKVRGERSEFSADDAGLLIESALRTRAHDLHVARIQGIKQAIVWCKSGGYDDLSEMTYKRIDEIAQVIAAGLEAKNEAL